MPSAIGDAQITFSWERPVKNRHYAGIALIALGGIFIAVTNNANRTSRLGLVVGVVMILTGVVRVFRARKQGPPAV